jgi:hypothetical protein
MKRRPILLKKLTVQKQQRICREVIGLMGTHHGAGVTFIGLMLAFYMGEELGRKTAFLEYNRHQDMRLIQRAYEWSNAEEYSFSYRQITCYREVKPEKIADILGEDYDCVIVDFGTDFTDSKNEFLRCTRKIVVGDGSEWNQLKLLQFAEATRAIRGNEAWLYLIPQAKERVISKMKRELKHEVLSVPMEPEPTRLSRSSKQFFKELLRHQYS